MATPRIIIHPFTILIDLVILNSLLRVQCFQLHPTPYPGSRSRERLIHLPLGPTIGPTLHMNKTPNYFDINETAENGSKKKNIVRRIRDRLSKTFSDKGDKNSTKEESEIKPSLLDAARLKLALAMSNINFSMFQRNEEWVVACPKTRVGPGVITPCVVNGLDIIIFASRDGKRLDAFANSCPHLGSPFDLATIEQKPTVRGGIETESGSCVDCIVCPVHRTAFEIQSGDVRGEWCPYPPVLGGIM